MRDNSGSGKGKNNLRDPTMRDHDGESRREEQEGRDFTEKSAFDIGGKERAPDEKTSPAIGHAAKPQAPMRRPRQTGATNCPSCLRRLRPHRPDRGFLLRRDDGLAGWPG